MGATEVQLWLRKNEGTRSAMNTAPLGNEHCSIRAVAPTLLPSRFAGSKRAAFFDPDDTLHDVYITILEKEHHHDLEPGMSSKDEMNKIALTIKDQTFTAKAELSKTLKECGLMPMDQIKYTLTEPLMVPFVEGHTKARLAY